MHYGEYALSGREFSSNLQNIELDAPKNIKALKVGDNDEIFENQNYFYLGADKEKNINLDYPIYINDSLSICNLSKRIFLITSDFYSLRGYKNFILSSESLFNGSTLKRADYYICY